MKTNNNRLLWSILIPLTGILLFQCRGGGNCPETDFMTHELITKYHKTYFDKDTNSASAENFAIYLDYSDGMQTAFADNNSMEFYELFINSLKISKVDFYEVNKYKVERMNDISKSELYKKIKDKDKFSGINAPLDKALSDLIDKNTEAVFITDGELWQDEERDDPWAREGFAKWLKAGNAIDFYITSHFDAGKEKHLFYMFFIPAGQKNSKESIANNFRFYIEKSAEAKQLQFKYLSFSNADYTLKQEYATATSGGVNENAALDETTYINKPGLAFEYHEYMMEWKDMVKYIRDEAYDDKGNKVEGGNPLISKLFLIDNMQFYSVDDIDINVYEIKTDYQRFEQIQEAKANPPTYVLNEKGEKVLDEENNPIIDCPGQYNSYDETGKLTIDTIFKPAQGLKKAQEVFAFGNKAFKNNIQQQGRGEIIVKIHENFDGSQISSEDVNLHRVDVYLKNVKTITDNQDMECFIWQGKQVEKNRAIYNSILGALNEANPQGKVIYTYYIKTQPVN